MRINFWYISSFVISLFVIIPILTVFSSFFDNTSNYFQVLKDTFLIEYIFNSLILLVSVLILTFFIGTGSAYLVSFFNFTFCNNPNSYCLFKFFWGYFKLLSSLKRHFSSRIYI